MEKLMHYEVGEAREQGGWKLRGSCHSGTGGRLSDAGGIIPMT